MPILERVGLAGRETDRVESYSKGMKQRLMVARALINTPDILFLDEPTDGLDPVGRSQVREIMRRLQEQGRTVFVNSHLLQEVELICDQVAILDKGKLRYVGILDELTPSDGTTLTFGLAGSTEQINAAVAAVAEIGGGEIHHSEANGSELQIHVVDQSESDRITDILRKHDVGITRLTRQRRSLEDAFLDLISSGAELEAELV